MKAITSAILSYWLPGIDRSSTAGYRAERVGVGQRSRCMNRLVVAAVALWCGACIPAETSHAQVQAQGYATYPAYYPYGIYPAYPYWTYPPYPYSAYPPYWAYNPSWGPPFWGPPYWGPRFGVGAGFVFGGHRRFHHHDFDHGRGFHHGGHHR